MKALKFLVFTSLICLSGAVAVAEVPVVAPDLTAPATKNMNFSVRPISLVVGSPNATVEFGVSQNSSVGVGAMYSNMKVSNSTVLKTKGDQTLNLVRKELVADWTVYLSGTKFTSGWFVAPRGGFLSISTESGAQSGVFGGAYFGRKWFQESGFNMSVEAGLKVPGTKFADLGFELKNSPADLDFGFQIGFAI